MSCPRKYDSGTPATPLDVSSAHRRVLPVRGVEQMRYVRRNATCNRDRLGSAWERACHCRRRLCHGISVRGAPRAFGPWEKLGSLTCERDAQPGAGAAPDLEDARPFPDARRGRDECDHLVRVPRAVPVMVVRNSVGRSLRRSSSSRPPKAPMPRVCQLRGQVARSPVPSRGWRSIGPRGAKAADQCGTCAP
jgi:hypothetical protein